MRKQMTEEIRIIVQSKIDSIPQNVEFGVKKLMGDDWRDVANKQQFGTMFKDALRDGRLVNIVHDRLENSPRHDVYRKIS
ncbi:MAG: DUF1413 domain-containing protein [Trichlorobacter sp.]